MLEITGMPTLGETSCDRADDEAPACTQAGVSALVQQSEVQARVNLLLNPRGGSLDALEGLDLDHRACGDPGAVILTLRRHRHYAAGPAAA
jgi:hypothetical protein